ncbi:MAG: selenocysteine-specific translation elongation factor [Anaerolineae bacterium]|nr:selenocysteine-specific translation elongation factor [Anaerolineae bacterium]
MRVIGTAGHVDHGKSTLVHALTGIDPDRLKEEKEREMTIDLGFAWLTLPGGERVGIVDVPGHKDFIKNMLAGVGGIDAALFVVAADEGVMPQTREHLAILDLLRVPGGVIALTKTDLAEDEDWIELVEADLLDVLEGTVLDGAPIVRVSARKGQGIEALIAALEEYLADRAPRRDIGRPRLPVDRVFTIPGFGTVVTGTLSEGRFQAGQEVEIQPSGLKARIRGLQTHKERIGEAVPGSRVAINLTGVSTDEVLRGQVVTMPGWLKPTTLVDCHLRYLPDAPAALRHNTPVSFFSGAAESIARVRLLGKKVMDPGEEGWVQLRLEEPVALVKGDRYILRQPSPSITIGGGIVINPFPGRRHRRFRPEVIEGLETLAHGSPGEILQQDLERREPSEVRDLLKRTSLSRDVAVESLHTLVVEGQVLVLDEGLGGKVPDRVAEGAYVVTRSGWGAVRERLEGLLEGYHRAHPLRAGMPREEVKSRLARYFRDLSPRLFNEVVARAMCEGWLAVAGGSGERLHLTSHCVQFTPAQEKAVAALLERFRQSPYTPPSVSQAEEAVGSDVFSALVEQGHLAKLSEDVVLLRETYEEMRDAVIRYLQTHDTGITVAQVRDMFDTSRKYTLAVLGYMDEQRITRRVGDERVLRGGGGG